MEINLAAHRRNLWLLLSMQTNRCKFQNCTIEGKLEEYTESKVKIVAELPSMQGHQNPNYKPNEIRNPCTTHTV